MRGYGYRKRIFTLIMAAVLAAGTVTGPAAVYAQPGALSSNEAEVVSSNETEVVSSNEAEVVSSDEAQGVSVNGSGSETVSEEKIPEAPAGAGGAGTYEGEAPAIPFGAIDDETVIDSPEPLPEFITDVTEQNGSGILMAPKRGEEEAAGRDRDYAKAYSMSDMGYLPEGQINQGNSSLCWAFTATMMGAISMIRKGLADKSIRYSPDQVGYFFYNRINDPLGNTPNDRNILILPNTNYWSMGGNNSFNTWSLASWISPRNYSDVPFTDSIYDTVSSDKAYSSTAHLQNAYWTSLYSEDAGNIDYVENVKELVYNYGGASIIISSSLNINENHAVYTPGGGGGHNVTIIGWDDSYPKENFSTVPPGDGAWYVRDSYDGRGNRDGNGCFWMSYYSRDLSDGKADKAIIFDFEPGDNFDNNYQYDGAAGNGYIGSGKKQIRVSNVFRAKGDEYLEAVAFAPYSTSMSYEINIYKLNEGYTSPVGETSLSRITGETRYAGYRTIRLEETVALSENDIFSVVIDAEDTSGADNASVFVENTVTNGDWLRFQSECKEKQSYYWNTDLGSSGASGKCCVRIKAFTDNAGTDPGKPEKKTAALAAFTDGEYTYDGSLHSPAISVNKGEDGSGELLTEGTDYTAACYNNKCAGEATVTVYSDKYRIRNASHTFTINPREFDDSVTAVPAQQTYVYDGTEKKPAVTVSDNKLHQKLKEGVDFTRSYVNNTEAGTAELVVTGIGNYTGEKRCTFTIDPLGIENLDFTVSQDAVYNGKPQTVPVKVIDKSGKELTEGTDYTVSAHDNVNAGTAVMQVTGKGNYSGSKNLSFSILPVTISGASIEGVYASYEYTGVDIKPEPDVTYPSFGNIKLEKDRDYTVEYRNNREEGDAVLIVKGMGNYTGQKETTFFISKARTLDLTVSKIPDQTFVPGSKGLTPAVTVKSSGVVLNPGSDYTAEYISNKDAGTASVRIRGVEKTIYDNSSTEESFTIKPFAINKATVTGISDRIYKEGQEYDVDEELTVISPVTGETVALKRGSDYSVTFENNRAEKINQNVKVIIDGKGNYKGRITKSFKLRSYIPMSDTSVFDISLSQEVYKFDGAVKKPEVSVINKTDGRKLSPGTDFKVSYASNKNAGLARVTVKPTSSYSRSANVKGSAVLTFRIEGKTVEDLTIASIPDKTYTGRQIKPGVKVYENGKRLSSSYYYLEYSDNVNAGTASINVIGRKNYSGLLGTVTFEIYRQRFTRVSTSYKKSTDELKVRYGNAILRESIDYTRDPENRIITSLETNFEEGSKKY